MWNLRNCLLALKPTLIVGVRIWKEEGKHLYEIVLHEEALFRSLATFIHPLRRMGLLALRWVGISFVIPNSQISMHS